MATKKSGGVKGAGKSSVGGRKGKKGGGVKGPGKASVGQVPRKRAAKKK